MLAPSKKILLIYFLYILDFYQICIWTWTDLCKPQMLIKGMYSALTLFNLFTIVQSMFLFVSYRNIEVFIFIIIIFV